MLVLDDEDIGDHGGGMLRRVAATARRLGAARLDSPVEGVMLLFVDRFGVIGQHFAREGFGHLRPAAQFLTELYRGALSLRRHDSFASRHPLLGVGRLWGARS